MSETIDSTALLATPRQANVLDAIKPFEADDGHKGTFLILRIAGVDKSLALKLINRKYRSWQHWRSTDEDFYRVDEQMPYLISKYSGEARVVRTALLDISIIETGISIFGKILSKQPVNSDMWSYVTKLAGIRMPMMAAKEESGSPWERLANSIRNTMSQKELTIQEVDRFGTTKTVTAKETSVQPSPEQQQMASNIVSQMLERAKLEVNAE